MVPSSGEGGGEGGHDVLHILLLRSCYLYAMQLCVAFGSVLLCIRLFIVMVIVCSQPIISKLMFSTLTQLTYLIPVILGLSWLLFCILALGGGGAITPPGPAMVRIDRKNLN